MNSGLSLVVITLNEEQNLRRCLESVKGVADEIIIVDSGSKDNTLEIAAEFSARIYRKEWMGYSRQKNFGNDLASFNMILSLDADEALSDELRRSILSEKAKGWKGVYSFARITNYCGVFIKHGGWYPDFKVRIFNRTLVKWVGEIHEVLSGYNSDEVNVLKGDCLHYSYYNSEQHWKQAEKFSNLAAEDLFKRGKKYSFIKIFMAPIFRFISGYFFNLGILDGVSGLKIAYISAAATKIKYVKLRQLWRNNGKS